MTDNEALASVNHDETDGNVTEFRRAAIIKAPQPTYKMTRKRNGGNGGKICSDNGADRSECGEETEDDVIALEYAPCMAPDVTSMTSSTLQLISRPTDKDASSGTAKFNCNSHLESVGKPQQETCKRQNVFKSIIDRLSRKDGDLLMQRQMYYPPNDPQFPTLTGYQSHDRSTTTSPHQVSNGSSKSSNPPSARHSPGPSLAESSSSALNLSFLFRNLIDCEDTGSKRSCNEETEIPKVSQSTASLHCHRSSTENKEISELNECSRLFMNGEILESTASYETEMPKSDAGRSFSGASSEFSTSYPEAGNGEASVSPENRLNTIKRKYHTSLDYLRKVRIMSTNLESERERLRVKRECLHRVLHRLRFLYNVTRLQQVKKRTLDRQTISTVWNLARFDESTNEECCHGFSKRFETGSGQSSSFGSSPDSPQLVNHLGDTNSGNSEDDVMELETEAALSFPVNYCIRDVVEQSHGSQCISDSRRQDECTAAVVRGTKNRVVARGETPRRSVRDDALKATNFTEESAFSNSFPAHSRANNRCSTGTYYDHTSFNSHRAHEASNRLNVVLDREPFPAHETKRDLSNFTYLFYSKTN